MAVLWKQHTIKPDPSAAAYAAAVMDEDGEIKVTRGEAILRVTIGATSTQIPILGELFAGSLCGKALLTGLKAKMFLEWIQPYVQCSKVQVEYALKVWNQRKDMACAYRKLVKDTAQGMPGKIC